MGITAKNLKKTYNKRTVVNSISLSVEKGEIVGLLGPNGAGKTTSFYMIVGIVKADSGVVEFNGEDITTAPIHVRADKGLGYLPQEPSVFRKLSVYQNIYATLELKYKDKKYIKDRTEQMIRDFNLEKVRDSKGIALSGGERRRVEIARCLSINPEIVLLDEPFAGIDPISVSDIQEMIYSLKELGIGVLITDHNVRETLKITDRAYIVADGNVLTEGTTSEIVNNKDVISKYLGEDFKL